MNLGGKFSDLHTDVLFFGSNFHKFLVIALQELALIETQNAETIKECGKTFGNI
jgi:hypothetical protein